MRLAFLALGGMAIGGVAGAIGLGWQAAFILGIVWGVAGTTVWDRA